jgi:chitodextrinase
MPLQQIRRLAGMLALAAGATISPLTAADNKPPTVPKGLTVVSVTANSVTLKWQASGDLAGGSGVAGYDVFRNGVQAGSTPDLTYTDMGLAAATTYQYAVRARDKAGNVSVLSVPMSATTEAGAGCSSSPDPPASVTISSVSSSTVTLQWDAVVPPAGCALTYNVYRDNTLSPIASGITGTTYTATGLQPSTRYAFFVTAVDSVGSSPMPNALFATTSPSGGQTTGFPAHLFAPYTDMLLYPTPSLSGMSAQSAAKYFSPGFIVAGSGCQATWGKHYTMSDRFLADDIASLRSQGGDVIVSFGGAANTELALACSTVSALQAQYQSVIDAYSLSRIDFDIEGTALSNAAANDRRAKAIKGLQDIAAAAGRKLTVQFTLPVMPSGLTADGVSLLQNALGNGVDIGVVNVMAMDYGRSYTGSMGEYAVQAMNRAFSQLQALYGRSRTDAALAGMVGITPMIGLNDVSPEVFTLEDARILLSGAQTFQADEQPVGIGFLSFWSAARDQPCPRRQVVSATCSGIVQLMWDFTSVFKGFTGNW